MSLFTTPERAFARAVSNLGHCNPFLPERFEFERQALGADYSPRPAVLSLRDATDDRHPNVDRLIVKSRQLLDRLRPKLNAAPKEGDGELYEDLVLFLIYHELRFKLDGLIFERTAPARRIGCYDDFVRAAGHYLPGRIDAAGLAHRFALCHQLRRAFRHIYNFIIGESMATARLRASVWQSIFTHDMRRYRRALYDRMGDLTCLITGPSGTGKELVAQAIALSRYIPFDPHTRAFSEDYLKGFIPLNISALSPTLVESELFGHKRGAFTGALQDRIGWLEACPPRGTVFMDEIGELDGALQVKLLRVLQTRTFQRTGETQERIFHGKIMAATNRDLDREMAAGRFRADFYYRLCADLIVTPSLREQLEEAPGALATLVAFLANRLAGEAEGPALAGEVLEWIEHNMARDYPWPGNVRELEQCVRNILVRKCYLAPAAGRRATAGLSGEAPAAGGGAVESLLAAVAAGSLGLEDLQRHYCSLVHAQTGSYQETARRLGVDHRTVKSRLSPDLLERYRKG